MSRLDALSGGSGIAILDSATTIHAAPAVAIPGVARGDLVHVEIINGSAGSLTMTIDVGGAAEDLLLTLTSKASLDVWVPAGEVLLITGSAVGATAYGYVRKA